MKLRPERVDGDGEGSPIRAFTKFLSTKKPARGVALKVVAGYPFGARSRPGGPLPSICQNHHRAHMVDADDAASTRTASTTSWCRCCRARWACSASAPRRPKAASNWAAPGVMKNCSRRCRRLTLQVEEIGARDVAGRKRLVPGTADTARHCRVAPARCRSCNRRGGGWGRRGWPRVARCCRGRVGWDIGLHSHPSPMSPGEGPGPVRREFLAKIAVNPFSFETSITRDSGVLFRPSRRTTKMPLHCAASAAPLLLQRLQKPHRLALRRRHQFALPHHRLAAHDGAHRPAGDATHRHTASSRLCGRPICW